LLSTNHIGGIIRLVLQSRTDYFMLISTQKPETMHSKPIPSDVVKNPDNGLTS